MKQSFEYELSSKSKICLLIYDLIPNIDIIKYIYDLSLQLRDQESCEYHCKNIIDLIKYTFTPIDRGLEWRISSHLIYHRPTIQNLNVIKMMGYPHFIQFINHTVREKIIKEKSKVFKQYNHDMILQSFLEYCYDDGRGIAIYPDKSIWIY